MRRLVALLAIIQCSATVACSSSSSTSPSPDASADTGGPGDGGIADSCAAIDSQCGQPCQPGNSKGVGTYCTGTVVCPNNGQATLCSWVGSQATHFCTFRCRPADAAAPDSGGFPTDCGEGAECTCDNSGNCGCTPTKCLGP